MPCTVNALGRPIRRITLIAGLLTSTPSHAQTIPAGPDIRAARVVQRLADLPPQIRKDLISVYRDMADRGGPLLQTDAPTTAKRNYPTSRFFQALFINNEWYVQYELTHGGRRTLGYYLATDGGTEKHFARAPWHYYGGPFCETLKAATSGFFTAGSINF